MHIITVSGFNVAMHLSVCLCFCGWTSPACWTAFSVKGGAVVHNSAFTCPCQCERMLGNREERAKHTSKFIFSHNHTQPHTITHNHTQPHTTTHKYTQPHTITHSHTQQILTHMSRPTAPLCIDNSSLILSFCSSHLFCCPSLYCISRASTLSVSLSLYIYLYMCVYHTHMCISCTSPFCPLCDFLCLFAVVRT